MAEEYSKKSKGPPPKRKMKKVSKQETEEEEETHDFNPMVEQQQQQNAYPTEQRIPPPPPPPPPPPLPNEYLAKMEAQQKQMKKSKFSSEPYDLPPSKHAASLPPKMRAPQKQEYISRPFQNKSHDFPEAFIPLPPITSTQNFNEISDISYQLQSMKAFKVSRSKRVRIKKIIFLIRIIFLNMLNLPERSNVMQIHY